MEIADRQSLASGSSAAPRIAAGTTIFPLSATGIFVSCHGARRPREGSLPQTITFSEQPLDTLNPVYLCKINTVSFTGVIVNDGSQPNSPALAHDASQIGSVGITFSNAVDFVQLDVGSFQSVGSTTLSFYDATGGLITSIDNSQVGVQQFSFTPTGNVKIGSVVIADAGSGSAPFSIDNLTFSNTPIIVDKTTV